jgi:hypothetical protein
MRWVQMRAQVLRGEKPAAKHVNALRAVDQRLRQVRFKNGDRDRRIPASSSRARYETHVVEVLGEAVIGISREMAPKVGC